MELEGSGALPGIRLSVGAEVRGDLLGVIRRAWADTRGELGEQDISAERASGDGDGELCFLMVNG